MDMDNISFLHTYTALSVSNHHHAAVTRNTRLVEWPKVASVTITKCCGTVVCRAELDGEKAGDQS